jgi:hypothetical protein
VEFNNDSTILMPVNHPGGRAGSHGHTGRDGQTVLADGTHGQDGRVQIFVENQNGQYSGPYLSSFHLEVADYDIVDSNEDGIIEFGEEITLKNIRVRNSGKSFLCITKSGGSPSPKFSSISVCANSSTWLAAPETKLWLPQPLMQGATVTLPGTITMQVKQANGYPAGPSYSSFESLELTGHMSRVDRTLPDFRTPMRIKLGFPVELTKPKFLRCMTVGQEAIFSWTVLSQLIPS